MVLADYPLLEISPTLWVLQLTERGPGRLVPGAARMCGHRRDRGSRAG